MAQVRHADPEIVTVRLSPAAVAVVAGLLAPSDEVNHGGIVVGDEVWAELREAFPARVFWESVAAVPDSYQEDFGL